MKLQLPDVTLLCIETQKHHHQLAKLAIEDCLAAADFGDVVVMSDQFNEIRTPGAHHVRIWEGTDKFSGYSHPFWYIAPLHIKTPQVLNIQWDSWITRPEVWKEEFLNHDYIGAPWLLDENHCPVEYSGPSQIDIMTVGNSGFSLRSRRLMNFLLENKEIYPLIDPAEDYVLSCGYRKPIEAEGFTWAAPDLALDFSVETVKEYGSHNKSPGGYDGFGFHGIFAWPYVLDKARLIERTKLVAKSNSVNSIRYVSGRTMLESLVKEAPWLEFFI